MGATPSSPGRLAHSHPLVIDEVATRHPELRQVIAHLGHPWQRDAVQVLRTNRNVYADVSGIWKRPLDGLLALLNAQEWGVVDRLFAGSDYPLWTPREVVDGLNHLASLRLGEGLPVVAPETVASILGSSWAYAEQEGYPYDVERAKQLVQESGKEGTSVTLDLLAGNPEAEQMARVWQQSLAEAGIDLKVRTSELSVWLDRYVNHDYDAIWNFFNVSGDPDSFFDVIMKPHLEDQYDNPQMQRLVSEAKSTTDQDARAEIYAQLQEMLVADVPVLTVQSRPLAAITSKNVLNLEVNSLGWPLLDGAGLEG